MPTSVWILAAIAVTALIGLTALMLWWTAGNRRSQEELPREWPLTQRQIFAPEERALYRQLRTALPHHVILAKLPLVRFCQPVDRSELRYWFELLGPIHVSFVVCAENGRALAALDIEKPHRKVSERTQKIKQAVLDACRIRYVKCRADQLPTASELALLVPSQGEAHRPWVPSSLPDHPSDMRSTLAHAVRARRGEAESQWVESGYSADSFFAPEGSAENTDSGPLPLTPERPIPTTPAARHDPLESSGRWAGATPRSTPTGFGNDDNEGTHIIGRR
jgi:hypothetical protein